MNKAKRVLALAGVIILVILYIITLVSAVLATPATRDFFMASLIATIMIPILIYVYILIYRLVTGRGNDQVEQLQESENKRGFNEAFHSKKGDNDEGK